MLRRQNFRRHHNAALITVFHRLSQCQSADNSLTAANVTLQNAVHRLFILHIERNFVFALLLCMVFATGLSAGARPLFGTPLADDPLQARIYRLDNGLTVAFSVNRETPNIRGCIAFRVGSGDDPADKTGLAHYLEHLLFKGSEKLGTTDYRAERPLLEQIEKLYDRREASRDPDERQELYREIDRLSAQAGQYTVQNEFVQAINEMGGSDQ